VELIVVIGLIALGVSFLLPSLCKSRETANRVKCASNLKQIGQGLLLYANENGGHWPRTWANPAAAVTAFTAADDDNPFDGAGDPADNDVTAALYLLVRTQDMGTEVFTCPSSDAEKFVAAEGVLKYANFPGRQNLGYSVAVMYPTERATALGYRWDRKVPIDFAVAADANPGGDPTACDSAAPAAQQKKLNSRNHDTEGQNVLFGDGHVEFSNTAFCGAAGDQIYAPSATRPGDPPPARAAAFGTEPTSATDSILLPAAGKK
jgi:prepilin-type processing-associated H-X9-DG protein